MSAPNYSRIRSWRSHFAILAITALAFAMPTAQTLGSRKDPGAANVQAADVYDIIERARKALAAKQYAEAGKAIDSVLQMPAFAELPSTDQFRAFMIAALAANGREDYLGAHEFLVIATEFPDANADTWSMRVHLASWVDDWADAGSALTTLGKRWPDAIAKFDDRAIARIATKMADNKKLAADRLGLLNVLFAAHFTFQWDTQPSELWSALVLDALQRKDLARAREIQKRITGATTLVSMRADRRYDELVRAEPKAFDIAVAANAECKRLRRIVEENPRSLSAVVQYLYAQLTVGGYQEVLTVADRTLARSAKAAANKPEFEDVADQLNWIYDLKAQALMRLGKWDQALEIQKSAHEQRDASTDKVSQAINLGFTYNRLGRPDDALKSLDGIDWANSLSGYGRMQLQQVRLRAYLQLGKRADAEDIYAYLREHRSDAPDAWQDSLLDWGDTDEAAAQFIERLHDSDDRAQALYKAQTFKDPPRLPQAAAEHSRWQAFLARQDVTAAINEVGRREKQPIFDIEE